MGRSQPRLIATLVATGPDIGADAAREELAAWSRERARALPEPVRRQRGRRGSAPRPPLRGYPAVTRKETSRRVEMPPRRLSPDLRARTNITRSCCLLLTGNP